MFEKVRKFCSDHKEAILVGIATSLFFGTQLAVMTMAYDGVVKSIAPRLPSHISASIFETAGKEFLCINDVLYQKD